MEVLFVGMLAVHSILFEENSALGLGNTLANLAVRCVVVVVGGAVAVSRGDAFTLRAAETSVEIDQIYVATPWNGSEVVCRSSSLCRGRCVCVCVRWVGREKETGDAGWVRAG